MTVTINNSTVSYVAISGVGSLITRIDLSLPTPRIMCYLLLSDGSTEPTYVFLDEMTSLVSDARTRLSKGTQ